MVHPCSHPLVTPPLPWVHTPGHTPLRHTPWSHTHPWSPPPPVGSMHPTGMLSCYHIFQKKKLKILCSIRKHSSRMRTDCAVTRMSSDWVANDTHMITTIHDYIEPFWLSPNEPKVKAKLLYELLYWQFDFCFRQPIVYRCKARKRQRNRKVGKSIIYHDHFCKQMSERAFCHTINHYGTVFGFLEMLA